MMTGIIGYIDPLDESSEQWAILLNVLIIISWLMRSGNLTTNGKNIILMMTAGTYGRKGQIGRMCKNKAKNNLRKKRPEFKHNSTKSNDS